MNQTSSKFQKIWLHSIIFLSPIYFRGSGSEGVSFMDVFFAVYFFGSLLLWLFWTILIQKKKIFHNVADFLLFAFYILALGTIGLSIANGTQLLDALREYIVIFMVLYYFPFRENFEDKKDLILLGFNFSFSVLINDLGQFYDYYKGLQNGLQYAYQIVTAVRINQTIFTFTIISGILFFLYPQKTISRIWILLVVSVTSIALITTFSRSFWVLVLVSVVFLFIVVPLKQKILLTISVFTISIAILFSFNFYFKDKAKIAMKVVENRLESSKQGSKDVSLQVRLVEYNALYKRIKENPLGGNGFFKKFTFYNIIDQVTARTITVHNGYLYLLYRLGIPLTLTFLFVYFYFAFKSLKVLFMLKKEELFYKFVAISGFIGLFILISADLASSQFIYRDGTFVAALSFAFIEITYKKLNELNEQKHLLISINN